jgi:hypothetical protein
MARFVLQLNPHIQLTLRATAESRHLRASHHTESMRRHSAAVSFESASLPSGLAMRLQRPCRRAVFIGQVLGAALGGVLCMSSTLCAQGSSVSSDPPESASLRLGPLALAPALSVTNLGWDSNVFQRADGESDGDFTATTSPGVQGWLRIGRARVRGRAALDFVYFQDHPSERSVDSNYEGRLDLPLRRLTPYVSGTWLSAKQRFSFEVDDRIRRHETSATGGVVLEIGPRTNVDIAAGRRRAEFNHEGDFQDPLVSEFDDYTSQGVLVVVRHDLTPFTSFAVTIDEHEDRFDGAPERDTNNIAISSGVEFQPFAMISGHAYVGWLQIRLVDGESPPFGGLTAAVNLAYTLLGATRFIVEAQRDVEYSAIRNQEAFLLAGVRVSINHRLGETWDVGARAARYHQTYGLFESSADPNALGLVSDTYGEIINQYGGEVGYRVGPSMRLGFILNRQHRQSTVGSTRQYRRTLAGMSLSYAF